MYTINCVPTAFKSGTGRATLRKLLPPLLAVALFAGSCAPVAGIRKQSYKGPAPREKADVASYYSARHDIPPDQWKWKDSTPYKIDGVTYYPLADAEGYEEKGTASWYGPDFHEKPTANGETYNQDAVTAAHRTLPFNTLVLVENLDNGRSVVVRVNDRGPYAKERIIDLSNRAATEIGMVGTGTARVKLTVKYAVKKDEVPAASESYRDPTDAKTPAGEDGNDPGRGFLPLGKKRRAAENAPAADAPAEPKKHRSYSGKMMRD
ncbi:MAG: septal ring lytic transglycosylase RlpA family protein [Nitrospinae bacterium]|nr:septal ring lytic transglycosylase RlpA family protein [Nitrospinota bacterium]